MNIGTVYREMYRAELEKIDSNNESTQRPRKNNQKALEYYKQALAIWRDLKSDSEEGQTHLHLAAAYSDLSEKQLSLEHYQEALKFFRAENNQKLEALALRGIGTIHQVSGDQKLASNYYNQALEIQQKIGDISGQQITTCFLNSIQNPETLRQCVIK